MEWQPIETAPKDGTAILAGANGIIGIPLYPITSRFIDGQWCAEFAYGRWHPYAPQPTHWNHTPPPEVPSRE